MVEGKFEWGNGEGKRLGISDFVKEIQCM